MATRVLYTPSGRAGEYADKGYAVNLYTGCPHNCRYCYVPSCMHTSREEWERKPVEPRKNILKQLERDLADVGKLAEPIFMCFTCDPFPKGRDNSITLEAVRLVKRSGNNLNLLTKGEIPMAVFHLLDDDDWVGITLTCHDDTQTWEPGAASYESRMANLAIAKSLGLHTWVSFEPVIDPDETIALILGADKLADLVKIGKSNHLARWNWPSEEWRKLVESIDWADFGRRAEALCQRLGLNYYIKQDLREAMEATNNAR